MSLPNKQSDVQKSTTTEIMPQRKYFDLQSTTPLDPRVLDAMLRYMTSFYGNPHSRSHSFGWEAEKATENSRKEVSNLINADPKEIIFTSGATESINFGNKGVFGI
jgi:cysteine desulfurase